MFQKGQASHVHWMSPRASGISEASGPKARESLNPLDAPRSGGDGDVSGGVSSQGAPVVWSMAQKPNQTLNSRLGKKRPSMKLRTL